MIADRHSEHVACAEQLDVLSAGEITFEISNDQVHFTWITNQSTGYCPEPESWPAVKNALDKAKISRPDEFSTKFIFRLCKKCNAINIVKDDWYVCIECDATLNNKWNFC